MQLCGDLWSIIHVLESGLSWNDLTNLNNFRPENVPVNDYSSCIQHYKLIKYENLNSILETKHVSTNKKLIAKTYIASNLLLQDILLYEICTHAPPAPPIHQL